MRSQRLRIELEINGKFNTTFPYVDYQSGQPTKENAKKYLERFNKTFEEGGSNHGASGRAEKTVRYTSAIIVNQDTQKVVAEYTELSLQEV